MKQQDLPTLKVKTKVKALPGNIKLTLGKSMIDKYEHAKAASAGSRAPKK